MENPSLLKSCPFCGETEMIDLNGRRCSGRYRGWIVFASCGICGAQSKVFSCEDDPAESEWSNNACYQAIKAWNRRADSRKE